MLPMASLPENSKDSAGAIEMMSSICLAITTVSFGVAAQAWGPGQAARITTARKARNVVMRDSFLVTGGQGRVSTRQAGLYAGPGRRVKSAAGADRATVQGSRCERREAP